MNWKESVGCVVKFTYDGIEGEISILEYNNSGPKLTLKYLDNTTVMYANHFMNCHIGTLIDMKSLKHCKRVGQIVKNLNNGELKILKLIRLGSESKKGYEYICLKCSNKDVIRESDMRKGRGCNVCVNKKTLAGFNDIWTTDPWLGKLLFNKKDGYNYSSQSGKKLDFKCSICDRKIKDKPVTQIYHAKGVCCLFCSDGFTYPEKFMYSSLEQLNISFDFHRSFEWSQGKEYDFYIPSLNCIIETHGLQHYKHTGRGRSLIEERSNDSIKEKLAIENNIAHYVVIDCRESELNWIKTNMINSLLHKLIDLTKIDWLESHRFSLHSTFVKKVCTSFNKGLTPKETKALFKISSNTYRRYLKRGVELGWCDYDPEKERQKNHSRNSKKIVQLTLKDEFVEVFASLNKAQKETGIFNLSKACKGKQKTAGGFKWMYLEDYKKIQLVVK